MHLYTYLFYLFFTIYIQYDKIFNIEKWKNDTRYVLQVNNYDLDIKYLYMFLHHHFV